MTKKTTKKAARKMTTEEKLEFYGKLTYGLGVMEEAALYLEAEPFCSTEPDNDVFCAALRMRIEKFRRMSENIIKDIFS